MIRFSDAPARALPGFWERCWADAETRAQRGTAILLLDEIQQLSDWAKRLKGYWDRQRRRHAPIHVVATGSSALRVSGGSRESLAGRFERMVLSHWSAASLASAFQLSASEAALSLVRFGSYPGAVALNRNRARWRAYIRDAIIEPAIGRDLLALGAIRRPALLRQVFAVAAGSPAQIVSLQNRNPKFIPLVIAAPGDEEIARRHGIRSVGWEDFLVSGPPPG